MAFQTDPVMFNRLRKIGLQKRMKIAQDPAVGPALLSALTPADMSELFPRYYLRQLPDVGGFRLAISKQSQAQASASSSALLERLGAVEKTTADISRPYSQRTAGGTGAAGAPGRAGGAGAPPPAQLTTDQKVAWEKLQQGAVGFNSPEGKLFSKLTTIQLASLGITKTKDNTGADVFQYAQPDVGREEAISRLKTSGGDKAILNMISKAEGTTHHGYNDAFGHQTHGELSNFSVSQIMQLQSQQSGSSAIGKYQFMKDTLNGFLKKGIINPDTKFTPELQDRLAVELMKEKGFESWKQGKMSDKEFMHNISTIWAGLTDPYTGKSHYEGVGLNKSTGFSINEQQNALNMGRVSGQTPGPGGQYSDEQINKMIEQLRTEKNSERRQKLADFLNTTPQGQQSLEVKTVMQGGDLSAIPNHSVHEGQVYGDGQCVALSKSFAPKIGHAGDWKFKSGSDGIVPGAVIATTNYGNGESGKMARSFSDHKSRFHTGVVLTQPDAAGNVLIYDQWKGKGAGISKVNINNYNGTGVKMAALVGGEPSDQSKRAIDLALANASPAERAAIESSMSGKAPDVAAVPSKNDIEKGTGNSTPTNQTDQDPLNPPAEAPPAPTPQAQAEVNALNAPTTPQPTAEVTKKEQAPVVETPKAPPNKFKLNQAELIAAIKNTDEFKNTFGSSFATDSMIIDGFFSDSRVKGAGVSYNPQTGVMSFKDPNDPRIKEAMSGLDTKKFMTPIEEKKKEEVKPKQQEVPKPSATVEKKDVSNPPPETPATPAPEAVKYDREPKAKTTPGASTGGDFTVPEPDGQINIYPLDKRDNLAAVNPVTNQPLFTLKDGESVSYDKNENRVNVEPQQKMDNARPAPSIVENRLNSIGAELHSALSSVVDGMQASRPTADEMRVTPNQHPNMVYESNKAGAQYYQNRAMHRAMQQVGAGETNHYNYGNKS